METGASLELIEIKAGEFLPGVGQASVRKHGREGLGWEGDLVAFENPERGVIKKPKTPWPIFLCHQDNRHPHANGEALLFQSAVSLQSGKATGLI